MSEETNRGRPSKKIENGKIFCSKCNIDKDISCFQKDTRSKSGYQSCCKDCQKEYRESHKDERQEYLEENKDSIAKKQKEYFLNNRDKINHWRRNYYSKDGRLKVLASLQERRAKKITTSDGSVTAEFIESLFDSQHSCCNMCGEQFKDGKNSFHVDHIIPLSKDGKHISNNIQLLCPNCNLKKGSKIINDYTTGRPTKYEPDYIIPIMDNLMKLGANIEEVCAELDIHKDTFYEWIKVHHEFSDAVKIAKQYSEAWWLKNGRENLTNKDFSPTLFYMNMKNRFNWADKQVIDNNNNNINTDTKDLKLTEEDKADFSNMILSSLKNGEK